MRSIEWSVVSHFSLGDIGKNSVAERIVTKSAQGFRLETGCAINLRQMFFSARLIPSPL